MQTLEIKTGEFMTNAQALLIAEGDVHEAWAIMDCHNDCALTHKNEKKVWSYEYDYTKEELDEIALVNSFTKAIRGTQAYYHAPYFFSEEDVEWNDIPF